MVQTDPSMLGKVCSDFAMAVITPNRAEKNLALSELREKVVILEFWATHSSPCIPSLKRFDKLQVQFGDAVKFIAISEESREN